MQGFILDIQHFFKILLFCSGLFFFIVSVKKVTAQTNSALNFALEEEWLVYDWDAEVYTAFIPEIHKNVKSLTILFDIEKHTGKNLHISHSLPLDIFINNRLLYSIQPESPLNINLSLLSEATTAGKVNLSISAYSETAYKSIPIIYFDGEDALNGNYYNVNKVAGPITRNHLLYENKGFLLLVIGMVILIATVHSLANPIFRFFSVEGLKSILIYNKSNINVKINITKVLTFLVFISLIYTISISMLNVNTGTLRTVVNSLENNTSFLVIINRFAVTYIILFVIFCIKLLLIWFTGQLFNLNNEANIHTNEYILLGQVFSLVLLFLIIFHGFHPQVIDKQMLVFFLSYGILIISIAVSIKVYRFISFKNVFIISYFCITEFIPALIMFSLF